jgi:hypothetical protein
MLELPAKQKINLYKEYHSPRLENEHLPAKFNLDFTGSSLPVALMCV